jgi:hypothetical protein
MIRITIVLSSCHIVLGAIHLAIYVAVCALQSRVIPRYSVCFFVAIIDPRWQ